MENLLTIGEFAEATRLSPKALRLYAKHGLLSPTRVDNDSGYRYYRTEQLHVARVIALLPSVPRSARTDRYGFTSGCAPKHCITIQLTLFPYT